MDTECPERKARSSVSRRGGFDSQGRCQKIVPLPPPFITPFFFHSNIVRKGLTMSMALLKQARKHDDVYVFIARFMRIERNKKNGGSCSAVRELARIYYRAHNING